MRRPVLSAAKNSNSLLRALGCLALIVALAACAPAGKSGSFEPGQIIDVDVEDGNTYLVPNPPHPNWCGDLWPMAWADNGYVYTANGDGYGFGTSPADIKMNRLVGTPPDVYGRAIPGAQGQYLGSIWPAGSTDYNRKPTGMICVDGVLYLFYQNLATASSGRAFDEAPVASISWSEDHGKTWEWLGDEPMFDNHEFTTGFFLDYGQCDQYAIDDYVYVYGLDHNWRGASDYRSTRLFLARVPGDAIPFREHWEFFAGRDEAGQPRWTADIADKRPVIVDEKIYGGEEFSGIAQGSVTYIPALDRYLYATWSWSAWIFWEAPEPWGPWTKVAVKWWSEREWSESYHGGYPTVVPSRFVSDDGREAWVVSSLNSVFENKYYRLAMRRIFIETD